MNDEIKILRLQYEQDIKMWKKRIRTSEAHIEIIRQELAYYEMLIKENETKLAALTGDGQ